MLVVALVVFVVVRVVFLVVLVVFVVVRVVFLVVFVLCLLVVCSYFQAVWAGWGHASENPRLPDTLSKHGIVFIGKSTTRTVCLHSPTPKKMFFTPPPKKNVFLIKRQTLKVRFFYHVGPPANAMWALGDKIASSIVAQTADVPTLPWNGSGETYSSGGLSSVGVANSLSPLVISPSAQLHVWT